jgi:hypothetical protein
VRGIRCSGDASACAWALPRRLLRTTRLHARLEQHFSVSRPGTRVCSGQATRPGVAADGVQLIRPAALREAELLIEPDEPHGLASSTQKDMLKTLRNVIDHAVNLGADVRGKFDTVKPIEPLPHPVYDEVVACADGWPERLWDRLPPRLHEKDGELATHLAAARAAAGVAPSASPLRVLDVIVWMRHHDEHVSSSCPGLPWPPTSG